MSAGFIGVVVPLYLAECLSATHRGKGTGIFQLLLTLGIVAAAIVGIGSLAERQYAAQAAEQEQKAETQRMRAKVVEAEAQVPIALADAFRSGNLGVMDYYRMNNIKADTEMRGAIGSNVGDAPAPDIPK